MNSSSLKKYYEEVPEEIRFLLSGLSDDKNLGIIVALLKKGKMTFNEMKEQFQLSPSSLSNRLNVLQDGNLIKNFYEKTGQRGFSYYDVTDFPELIFNSIYEIMYPTESTKEFEEERKEILSPKDWTKAVDFNRQEKELPEEKFEPLPIGMKSRIQKARLYQTEDEIGYQQISNATTD